RHPDVGAIESHSKRVHAGGKGAQGRTVTGPQLEDAVAALVRHPGVGSIEGDVAEGTPPRKGAHDRAVARPQLRDPVVRRCPEVGAVEGEAPKAGSHGERA